MDSLLEVSGISSLILGGYAKDIRCYYSVLLFALLWQKRFRIIATLFQKINFGPKRRCDNFAELSSLVPARP